MFFVLGVVLGMAIGWAACTDEAQACNDGRPMPGCSTTTTRATGASGLTGSSGAPSTTSPVSGPSGATTSSLATTTTRAIPYDVVIEVPSTTRVQIVDSPPVVQASPPAAAPAVPTEIAPRFAG